MGKEARSGREIDLAAATLTHPYESASRAAERYERERLLAEVRDRFFPGWWTAMDDLEPRRYRVVCSSDEDRRLAEAAKPDFIDAIIVLEGGTRGQRAHDAALRRWRNAGLIREVSPADL